PDTGHAYPLYGDHSGRRARSARAPAISISPSLSARRPDAKPEAGAGRVSLLRRPGRDARSGGDGGRLLLGGFRLFRFAIAALLSLGHVASPFLLVLQN